MITKPTHCFGCRQFENRHITISLFDYAESQETNSDD